MKGTIVIIAILIAVLAASGVALSTGDGGKTLVYGGGGQGKVVFDGRVHASKGMVCNDCHLTLFQTQKKALITMADHSTDRACFACHNGKRAFNTCTECHRKI
ncbi:MAG: cytochrome c3 family protein [Syntrophales bacterium]|nr:cytochrome c3 family protein [Syntrophales bacterium]